MLRAWAFGGAPAQLEPTSVTAVEGVTFCISGRAGDIRPGTSQGLFFQDTRFISGWQLMIDGQPVAPLAVHRPEPYAVRFIGQRPPAPGLADSTVLVVRNRYVGAGMLELITIHNLSAAPATVEIALTVEADFAGLFEVKEGRAPGRRPSHQTVDGPAIKVVADGVNQRRAVLVTDGDGQATVADGLVWHLAIEGRKSRTVRLLVDPIVDDVPARPLWPLDRPVADSDAAVGLTRWERRLPRLDTSSAPLERVLSTSIGDLGGLRITDPARPSRTLIAAGAPWFMTLFGRDSLLTSWMLLPLDLSLASGVLQALAERQGRRVDPVTEEQPGRILHEVRSALDAQAALGGGSVYYGTVDATPLFVMLLDQAHRWGLADADVQSLLGHADRAISWIEEFGDRDGDGFVEYQRATDKGLANQGWKDSFDAISFADGTPATPPIALAEVQGYMYAAYRARARLAEHFDEPDLAAHLTNRADALRRQFNLTFWLPDRGHYALALDRHKRPVDALASNMGHCLWTGIVDSDKAPSVAARLAGPEMFSGFGVRTLATTMGTYNPVSYHNGSVWPHDTAIAVAGLMRYGFAAQAQRITLGLLDAADRLGGHLPELLCGFDRSQFHDPVPYPSSCSPQAWAAAAPLLIMRSLLRLDPDLPAHRIACGPALPRQLVPTRIDRLRLGPATLSLTVGYDGWQLDGLPDDIHLDR